MVSYNVNIFQFLIVVGSVQGVVFSLVVFLNKRFNHPNNRYLGIMVFAISISNLLHMAIDMSLLAESHWLRKLYPPFQWIILPSFYLHIVSSLSRNKPDTKTVAKWFLPAFLVTISHTVYYVLFSSSVGVESMPDFDERGFLLYSNFASFIFNGFVLHSTIRLLDARNKSKKNLSIVAREDIQWYKNFVLVSFGIIALGAIVVFSILFMNQQSGNWVYVFFLLVSIVLYYAGYKALARSMRISLSKRSSELQKTSGGVTFNKISQYIKASERYRDHTLSVDHLSKKFNLSNGYISHLFNRHGHHSFNDYVNQLRINASKEMLGSEDYRNYTIEAIGMECGFNSKSNFYSTFKKITGTTPNKYKQNKK